MAWTHTYLNKDNESWACYCEITIYPYGFLNWKQLNDLEFIYLIFSRYVDCRHGYVPTCKHSSWYRYPIMDMSSYYYNKCTHLRLLGNVM
jgi:hypothetical protein